MSADLGRHGRQYEFEYPPHGNSDHLPMAWLAMGGLSASPSRREAFAAAYLPRLVARPAQDPVRDRQEIILADIEARGMPAVLSEHLPHLVSGWYRAAYHPFIRIGYGVEFDEPAEVAAGLTYLEVCGASPRLAALAAGAKPAADTSGLDLLARAHRSGFDPGDAASFDARADSVLDQPQMAELAVVLEDNLREMSRAALAAFAATHDFFALHLVTASHAYRLLWPWVGPEADAVMNLGLLAGYGAIGAPQVPTAPPAPRADPLSRERLLALCEDDEHHFKIAYSAWAQARHWREPPYLTAVAQYLTSA